MTTVARILSTQSDLPETSRKRKRVPDSDIQPEEVNDLRDQIKRLKGENEQKDLLLAQQALRLQQTDATLSQLRQMLQSSSGGG